MNEEQALTHADVENALQIAALRERLWLWCASVAAMLAVLLFPTLHAANAVMLTPIVLGVRDVVRSGRRWWRVRRRVRARRLGAP